MCCMSQWLKITKVTATKTNNSASGNINVLAINTNSIGTINTPWGSFTYNQHLVSSNTVDINKVINPSLKKTIYIRKT